MYYVYLLKLSNGSFYTGQTDDLKRRFKEHQQGKSPSTKNKRPLELIYYEAYVYRQDAAARERYLKTGDGRKSIQKQLKFFLSQ